MKCFIDCDPGIDDALALVYALRCEDLELTGISTVAGNTSALQGTDNVLRLLKLAGAEGTVPVCTGCEHPLVGRTRRYPAFIHGKNGLADLELPASAQKAVSSDVCTFLYETACRQEGELVLITLGRLTNVAQTLRRYPDFAGKVRRVVAMGGAVFCPGNITPAAEANLYGDPEAAQIVLAAPWDVTMVGLDVTMKTLLTRSDLARLLRGCEKSSRALADFLSRSLEFYTSATCRPDSDGCPLHDPLAVIAAVHPETVSCRELPTRIDCTDSGARGRLLVDEGGPLIRHALQVDSARAVRELLAAFGAGERLPVSPI